MAEKDMRRTGTVASQPQPNGCQSPRAANRKSPDECHEILSDVIDDLKAGTMPVPTGKVIVQAAKAILYKVALVARYGPAIAS